MLSPQFIDFIPAIYRIDLMGHSEAFRTPNIVLPRQVHKAEGMGDVDLHQDAVKDRQVFRLQLFQEGEG